MLNVLVILWYVLKTTIVIIIIIITSVPVGWYVRVTSISFKHECMSLLPTNTHALQPYIRLLRTYAHTFCHL